MNLNQREFDSAFITPPPKIYDATIFSSEYLNREPTRKIQSRISQNPNSVQIPSTFSLPNTSSSISHNKRSFPYDTNVQVEDSIKRQNISTYVFNDYRRYNYQHYQEIPPAPPSMTVDEFDRLVFPSPTGVPIHEDLNDILNKPIPVDDDEIGHLSFSDLSESILPEEVPKPPVSHLPPLSTSPPLPSRSAPTTPIHSRTSSSHYLPSSSHYTPSSSHYSPPPSSSYTPSSIPPHSSPYTPSSIPASSSHYTPASSIPPHPSISSQSQALTYKQQGNQAFERDAYEEACSYYTLSLVFEPKDPIVFSNRAACYMSLHRPKKALKDALMSIQLNPQFIRGYCRAGKAYLIQGELTESLLLTSRIIHRAKNMYSQAIILLNQQQQQEHKMDINRYNECKTCLQVIKEVHTQVQSLPIVYTSLQHVKATVQLLLTIKKTCYAWRSLYLQLLHCYLLLYDLNSTSILLSHITPSLLPSLTQYQNSQPFTAYPFTIEAWDAAAIDIFNQDVSGVDIEVIAYWCYFFIMKQQLMECIQLLKMVQEEPRFKDHKTAQRLLAPLAFINQLNIEIEESKQQYKKKEYNQCLLILSSSIDHIQSYYHQYGKKEYPISLQNHKRFSSCLENIVFDNCLCTCFEIQIRCLYHCEQYQSVIDECEKLLQYQEDNCTAIKKRGQAYCILHLFDQGLTDIRLYLSYKPNDRKVLSYYSFIQEKIEQEKKRKLASETPFNSYQYNHGIPKQSNYSSPFKSKREYSFPSKFEATFHPSEPASEGNTSDEPGGPGSNYSGSGYHRSYTGSSSQTNRRFIHHPSRDYYALLGVSNNASEKEIRQSYLRLARQYHPDKNPSEKAQALFVRIKEAYDVLSDPVKRKKYDVSY